MIDPFNRKISYLRISVTDRCDLRCTYCMPSNGVDWIDHNQILSFEEILNVVTVAVNLGIEKIRITGGEPLVRKGIVDLVKMIAGVPGVKDFAMTTNGQQLEYYAKKLVSAGLKRVNVSMDTLDAKKYKKLSRGGNISRVFRGLESAKDAGLFPIKINCVLTNYTSEKDKFELKSFCNEYDYDLRFIRQMSLEDGSFYPVDGGEGGQCANCNRIRLTAQGIIKPCLFSNNGYNIKEYGIENAFKMAVRMKPKTGQNNKVDHFYNIGG